MNLPGKGSYAQLPSNIFDGLTEATIEGWTKWTDGQPTPEDYEIVFSIGNPKVKIYLGSRDRSMLQAGILDSRWPEIVVPNAVQPGVWFHWALVTGPGGMKLFVNGLLAGSSEETGSLGAVGKNDMNYLGRNTYLKVTPLEMNGQMDEVRVWRVRRTGEQIKQNLTTKLTGNEPGLFALWNFDDPGQPMRDRSTNGFHGQLMGQATVTDAGMPLVVSGKITDAAGKPVAGATVTVHQPGQNDHTFTASEGGEYVCVLGPLEPCDIFVTTGELSAYRLGFQPTAEPQQRLDWTLADPEKTPVVLGSSGFGVPASAGSASAIPQRLESPNAQPAEAGTPNPSQFPAGTVVATVLTDEQGNFKFPNVKPGAYQVRAQIPGGRAWFDAGRILYANPEPPDAERDAAGESGFSPGTVHSRGIGKVRRAGRTAERPGVSSDVRARWRGLVCHGRRHRAVRWL